MGTCARLRLVQRVLIAAAGDIKSINISECGLDWCLPAPIIARLPHLQELHCMTESEVKDSKLLLPPPVLAAEEAKKEYRAPASRAPAAVGWMA